jgi:IPT/TIG domain
MPTPTSGTFRIYPGSVESKTDWRTSVSSFTDNSDAGVVAILQRGGGAFDSIASQADGADSRYFVDSYITLNPGDIVLNLGTADEETFVSFNDLPAGFKVSTLQVHSVQSLVCCWNDNFGGLYIPSYLTHAGTNLQPPLGAFLGFDPQQGTGIVDDCIRSVSPVPTNIAAFFGTSFGFFRNNTIASGNQAGWNIIRELYLEGSYVLESFSWWISPNPATHTIDPGDLTETPRDACGVPVNEEEERLVYSDTSPGEKFAELEEAPVPVIDTVVPPAGSKMGGNLVTIHGHLFSDGATVTFGDTEATDVVVVSQYKITCTAPPNEPGEISVIVTNADGTSSA